MSCDNCSCPGCITDQDLRARVALSQLGKALFNAVLEICGITCEKCHGRGRLCKNISMRCWDEWYTCWGCDGAGKVLPEVSK